MQSGDFAQLAHVKHLALDMDGTLYRGGTLFDCTLPFLESMLELGIGVTYLTNNSSKSVDDYLAHLQQMGISAAAEQLFTSATGTIEYLRKENPDWQRLYVLGTKSLRKEFAQHGYILIDPDSQQPPDAVVVAFDKELAYDRFCKAGYWIQQGKPFIATHPDLVCPTDEPTLLIDCGALTACLVAATGRSPDLVLGKPHAVMLDGILRRHGLAPRELAMVGDRLATDVAMANQAKTVGVLVLTGEARAADVDQSTPRPDLVVDDLAELGRLLLRARNDAG